MATFRIDISWKKYHDFNSIKMLKILNMSTVGPKRECPSKSPRRKLRETSQKSPASVQKTDPTIKKTGLKGGQSSLDVFDLDDVGGLPLEIWRVVLSYLPVDTLCKCSKVKKYSVLYFSRWLHCSAADNYFCLRKNVIVDFQNNSYLLHFITVRWNVTKSPKFSLGTMYCEVSFFREELLKYFPTCLLKNIGYYLDRTKECDMEL